MRLTGVSMSRGAVELKMDRLCYKNKGLGARFMSGVLFYLLWRVRLVCAPVSNRLAGDLARVGGQSQPFIP